MKISSLILLLFLSTSPFMSGCKKDKMNKIQTYESLVESGRYEEAIPVILDIIEQAPEVDTSWFNYGVCLDEVGKHSEAAEAFIKAQEYNVQDWGIHYRIIRSLYLAQNYETLFEFTEYSCGLNPEIMDALCDDDQFSDLFERNEFIQLRDKYKNRHNQKLQPTWITPVLKAESDSQAGHE